MKKLFAILVAVLLVVSCSKGVKIDTKGAKLKRSEAINILKSSLQSLEIDSNLKFAKTIVSDEGNAFAFLWSKEGTNKKFLRFWEVYGSNLEAYVKENSGKYTIKVKSDSVDNNCYGYVFDEPRVSDNGVKVVWDDYSKFGCSHNLELTFNNKDAAYKFVEALASIKAKPIKLDLVKPEPKEPTDNTENKGTKCTVDKILKMQEIGLSKEEIKKVCE
ncbi:MAG: hypothetical protein PWQ25_1678 [Deferribacteres bacterium]|jgi:hypothetical protein|nr:hypothetical protein [Deferribacteraceae bacterium]MDK2792815.1 hypothetical protein [Deferribacteres bacterium]